MKALSARLSLSHSQARAPSSRVPIKKKRRTRRPIAPRTYALFFLFFALIIIASHAPFFDLPFFWDEVGQFVPAALFSILALVLFLDERIFLSALACVALVLAKETGVVTPVLLGFWLLVERRLLQAGFFLLPLTVLGFWFLYLHHHTGYLFGSAQFTQYNLEYMWHPVRITIALTKRLYHLFWENLHWIGALGILYACIRGGVYEGRSWRVAW